MTEHEHGKEALIFWALFGIAALTAAIMGYMGIELASYIVLVMAIILTIRFLYKLAHRVFTVDLLMAIVGYVGFYTGIPFEVGIIYILYSIAETSEVFVESLAVRRIKNLRGLLPSRVLIRSNGRLVEKPLEEIRRGDVVAVRRGDVVPVDGVLLNDAVLDTRYVTGEHEPRFARAGETVDSGSINVSESMVFVRALREPGSSLLAILVKTAEEVLERKTRIQRLLERMAPWYTAFILAIFALLYLQTGPYRSLAVLLAGCPSAFIIASSFTTVYTIATLTSRSIVVRGGTVLEALHKCRVLVLDKTGTVTLGELRVRNVEPINGFEPNMVLKYACAAAKASRHPVARALARHCAGAPSEAREYPGRGVVAKVDGKTVAIGSKEFILEIAGENPHALSCEGSRSVYVAVDGRLAGVVCLEEELAGRAREVIDELRSMGIHIVLASGDRKEAVEQVARRLGITEYYYEMKPEDKLKLVQKLREKHQTPVAMVGDGINDVEALAGADIGIAVGDIDVVIGVADAVLQNGIEDLPTLFKAGRRHAASLKAAFTTAALVKMVAISGGLTGLFPLWLVAGLGDDGSTILSIVSATPILRRLGRKRRAMTEDDVKRG